MGVIAKGLFAAVMFLGVLIAFAARNYSLALFFATIAFITIWLIRTRPKADIAR